MDEAWQRMLPHWGSDEPLCLTFANTVSWRPSSRRYDWLASYRHLVAWSEHLGLLDAPRAPRGPLCHLLCRSGRPPRLRGRPGAPEPGAGPRARAPALRSYSRGLHLDLGGQRCPGPDALARGPLRRRAADLPHAPPRPRVRRRVVRLAVCRPQPRPAAPVVHHGGLRQPGQRAPPLPAPPRRRSPGRARLVARLAASPPRPRLPSPRPLRLATGARPGRPATVPGAAPAS